MSKQDEAEMIAAALERSFAPLVTAFTKLAERMDRLEAGRAPQSAKSADETMADMMKAIRGDPELVASIGLVEVIPGCTSDLGAPTAEGVMRGATFDAEVHYKPVVVNGKLIGKGQGAPIVKSLLNYAYPEGSDKHQKAGGLVPDGLEMVIAGANGVLAPNKDYEQWRFVTFWQADLKRFVGKVLPAHVRPQEKATGT